MWRENLREEGADCRFQISDFRFQISDFRSQIADYGHNLMRPTNLSIFNLKSAICNLQSCAYSLSFPHHVQYAPFGNVMRLPL
jgi:hypothetical protein